MQCIFYNLIIFYLNLYADTNIFKNISDKEYNYILQCYAVNF